MQTSDVVEKDFETVDKDGTLGDLVKAVAKSRRNIFPVVDASGIYDGYISLDSVREIMFDRDRYETTKIEDLMLQAPAKVNINDRMETVMDAFDRTGAWNLPVVDSDDRYIGYVSKSKIFSAYRSRLKEVSCD